MVIKLTQQKLQSTPYPPVGALVNLYKTEGWAKLDHRLNGGAMVYDWVQKVFLVLGHYGTTGLFVLSFVEASFFPLPPYLLLAPMTLAAPHLGLWYALIGTVGSVLGGILGYAIGFRVGRPILVYLVKPARMNTLEAVFTRFGGWALVVGGVTPVPYKIFAIATGVFRMPVFTFFSLSVLSRGVHFFTGALLIMIYRERMVGFLKKSPGIASLILLASVILIAVISWRISFSQKNLIPMVSRLKSVWLAITVKINDTVESLSRFGWCLVTGGTLIIFGFWLFTKLAEELFEHELAYFDSVVGQALISFRTPWLNQVMKVLTNLGSTPVIIIALLFLTVIGIIYRRFLTDFLMLDLCTGGALGLTEILKTTFHRPRPPHPWLSSAGGFSFPSGHSLITLSVYGFLAYLAVRNSGNSRRRIPAALCLLAIAFLVGISRIYLGVHFPSDVLAGWAVAAAWLGTCIAGREILRSINQQAIQ